MKSHYFGSCLFHHMDQSLAEVHYCALQGPNLDIVSLAQNERLSAWSFSAATQDPETEITALALFSSEPGLGPPSHVLVGLDSGLAGLLAVFSIAEGRVVRAVALPQRVRILPHKHCVAPNLMLPRLGVCVK